MEETLGFARLVTAWWWVLVVVVALIASGLIQWAKELIKRPWSLLWSLMLPLLTLAMALAAQPWPWWPLLWGLGWIFGQLGYQVLLQGVLAWIAQVRGPNIPVPPPATGATGPPT